MDGYYEILAPRAKALLDHPDPAVRDFAAETVREIEVFQLSEDSYREAAPDSPYDLEAYLASVEKNLICKALEKTEGNQTAAAEYLKLTKPSLRHKLQTLGIDAAKFKRTSSAS